MPKSSSSMKKTSLSLVEKYELNQWLKDNEIHASNLRRSFTDVHPLARLMSRYYPELIDLNYYPPRNSVQNKLYNWEAFNKRVLARLNLNLTREQMIRVARSEPGSVDLVLYSVMQMAERQTRGPTEKDEADQDQDQAGAEARAEDSTGAPEPVSESKPAVNQTNETKASDSAVAKGVPEKKKKSASVTKNQKLNRSSSAAKRNKKQQGSKEPGSSFRLRGRQTSTDSKRR